MEASKTEIESHKIEPPIGKSLKKTTDLDYDLEYDTFGTPISQWSSTSEPDLDLSDYADKVSDLANEPKKLSYNIAKLPETKHQDSQEMKVNLENKDCNYSEIYNSCLSKSQIQIIKKLYLESEYATLLDKSIHSINDNSINELIRKFVQKLDKLTIQYRFIKSKNKFHDMYIKSGDNPYEEQWNSIMRISDLDLKCTKILDMIAGNGIIKNSEDFKLNIYIEESDFKSINKWWLNPDNNYLNYCKIEKKSIFRKGKSVIKGYFQFKGRMKYSEIKSFFVTKIQIENYIEKNINSIKIGEYHNKIILITKQEIVNELIEELGIVKEIADKQLKTILHIKNENLSTKKRENQILIDLNEGVKTPIFIDYSNYLSSVLIADRLLKQNNITYIDIIKEKSDYYEYGIYKKPNKSIYFKQDNNIEMCCQHYKQSCKCAYKTNLERKEINDKLIQDWGFKDIDGYYCKYCEERISDLELSTFDGFSKSGGLIVQRELIQDKKEEFEPNGIDETEIYFIILELQDYYDIELSIKDVKYSIQKIKQYINKNKQFYPIITQFIQFLNDKILDTPDNELLSKYTVENITSMKENNEKCKLWIFQIQNDSIFKELLEEEDKSSEIPLNLVLLKKIVKLYNIIVKTKNEIQNLKKIKKSDKSESFFNERNKKLSKNLIDSKTKFKRNSKLIKKNDKMIGKINKLLKIPKTDSNYDLDKKIQSEKLKINIETNNKELKKEQDEILSLIENLKIDITDNNSNMELSNNYKFTMKELKTKLSNTKSKDKFLLNKLINKYQCDEIVLNDIFNYLELYRKCFYINIENKIFYTSTLFYMNLVISIPEYDPDIKNSRSLGKKSYGNYYLLYKKNIVDNIENDFNFKILIDYCDDFFKKYKNIKLTKSQLETELLKYQEIWNNDQNIQEKIKLKEQDYILNKEIQNLSWKSFKPYEITVDEIKVKLSELYEHPAENQIYIDELTKYLSGDVVEMPRGILDYLFTKFDSISDLKSIKLIEDDRFKDFIYKTKPLNGRYIDLIPIYNQLGQRGIPYLNCILNNSKIILKNSDQIVESIYLSPDKEFEISYYKYNFDLKNLNIDDLDNISYENINNKTGIQRYYVPYDQIIKTPKENLYILKNEFNQLLFIGENYKEEEYITQLAKINIKDYDKYIKIISILKIIYSASDLNEEYKKLLDYDIISDNYRFQLKDLYEDFGNQSFVKINKFISNLISNQKYIKYNNLYLIDTLILHNNINNNNKLINTLYFQKTLLKKIFKKFESISIIKITEHTDKINLNIINEFDNLLDIKYNELILLLKENKVSDFISEIEKYHHEYESDIKYTIETSNISILDNFKLDLKNNINNLFTISDIYINKKTNEALEDFKSRIQIEFLSLDNYINLTTTIENKTSITNHYIQVNILIQFLLELQLFSYNNYKTYIDNIHNLDNLTIGKLEINYFGQQDIHLIEISYIKIIINNIILNLIKTILKDRDSEQELIEFINLFIENIKIRLLTNYEIEKEINEQNDQQGKFSKLKYNQMTKEEKLTQQLFREFNLGNYFTTQFDDINNQDDFWDEDTPDAINLGDDENEQAEYQDINSVKGIEDYDYDVHGEEDILD